MTLPGRANRSVEKAEIEALVEQSYPRILRAALVMTGNRDDADDLTKYRIADGTTISPGGFLLLYEDLHFGNEADPGCLQPFALSRTGETLHLHSNSGGGLGGGGEQMSFGASDPTVTFGRYANSMGGFDLVPLTPPTPGGLEK